MDAVVKVAVDVLNRIMEIKKITKAVCKTTRTLWEEVFPEDSIQFTDYYFEHKAPNNIGYVTGEEPYDAMMFRTPYELCIGKEQREISYLVGVATREECRHRGYMRRLLLHSFQEMYEEKQPFTFLMPANPAIYRPFGFRYIYERDVWKLRKGFDLEKELEETRKITPVMPEDSELKAAGVEEDGSKSKLSGLYSVRQLLEDLPILDMLAKFANEYMEKHYNIYVHRDVSYYEMQLKESQAQNGDIYVLLDEGTIKAFFLYAKEEEEVFLQEVMEAEEGILDFLQKEEKKKPIVMARIIHLEEMMKLVCSKEARKIIIKIEDDLIPQNEGIYHWDITEQGSRVTKIQPESKKKKVEATETEVYRKQDLVAELSMHVQDFINFVFKDVFINEIV